MFLFAKQTNPNQSNRRSTVQSYFPLNYSLTLVTVSVFAAVTFWRPKRGGGGADWRVALVRPLKGGPVRPGEAQQGPARPSKAQQGPARPSKAR